MIDIKFCNECPCFEENLEAGAFICKLSQSFFNEEYYEKYYDKENIEIPDWCKIKIEGGQVTLKICEQND